jgi:hypothetical protein
LDSLPVKRLKIFFLMPPSRDPPSATLLPAPFYFMYLAIAKIGGSTAPVRMGGAPDVPVDQPDSLADYSPGDIGFDLKPTDPEELLAVQTKLRTDVLPCLPPLVS